MRPLTTLRFPGRSAGNADVDGHYLGTWRGRPAAGRGRAPVPGDCSCDGVLDRKQSPRGATRQRRRPGPAVPGRVVEPTDERPSARAAGSGWRPAKPLARFFVPSRPLQNDQGPGALALSTKTAEPSTGRVELGPDEGPTCGSSLGPAAGDASSSRGTIRQDIPDHTAPYTEISGTATSTPVKTVGAMTFPRFWRYKLDGRSSAIIHRLLMVIWASCVLSNLH